MMKTSNFLKTVLAGALVGATFSVSADSGDREPKGHKKHYSNGCAHYQISVYGGDGAVRLMSNPSDLRRVSNSSRGGKFCASGQTQIELAKRNPGTHVKFEINGKRYHFGQGDHGHRHLKGWYRKYINVNLPYQSSHYGYNSKPYSAPVRQGHYGYNNHYPRGYNNGYSNHGYSGNRGYNRRNHNHGSYYNDEYAGGYGHGQGYSHRQWFSSHSRKHKRAHKRGYDHIHRGAYFAFR
ncbi:MAG: hypothetical protein AAF402_09710 [Pseudomonadota bacterium]